MIARAPQRVRRRRRPSGAIPDGLHLNFPAPRRMRGGDWLGAVVILALIAVFLFSVRKLPISKMISEETVQIVEVAPPPPPPPPPPPKVIPPPPKPKPPPPPPEPKAPPPPPTPKPPPPVFGLDDKETSDKGDLAVATGNTLMKKPDSIVQKTPPPPPPQPVQISQEPDALNKVMPVYPEWAEEQGVTSTVLVTVTIDAQGRVVDASIQKSGGKDFDTAALTASRATRYKPYIDKGQALPARFTVTYQFVL